MSLRFIYGRAGSGKTTRCLNEIKARMDGGAQNPLVLLVPEQFTFQAERDLIRVLGKGGILGTEVLSFRRLAFRVFNDVGGITQPHIHSAGKCMILYDILDKLRDSLRIFARSADRRGFVNTLSTLITEFKRYNITPADLEAAGKKLGPEDPLKQKLGELNAVYAAFEKKLEERYRDSDDDLTLASEKLEATGLYNSAEIWIDGFTGFTPQEYMVAGKLLSKAARVTVSLCTDSLDDEGASGTDIFSAVRRAYAKYIRIAGEYGIEVEPPVNLNREPLPRFKDSPELGHLERNLYSWPHRAFAGKTKDVSLFSSVNIFSEIEAAARDIVGLCRDTGMRYRDIAVVTRDLASCEKLIEVIFDEYGIPCFIDRKVDIANHPLVRMLLSMLDIFVENWSYEAVFRYLKTGLTNIERDDIDRLENYVLACGIRGSRWTGEQDWSMTPGLLPGEQDMEKQDEMLSGINRIRREVTGPLLEFRKRTKGRRKAPEICGALYDFLCAIGVPGRIGESIEDFRKSGRLSLANEYSQVWNIVMEVFDQTVEVMGEEALGIERFSSILGIGFGEYKVGLIPAALDQVLVGSVERSKSHEIKALYVIGANDGVFPAAAAEEGVLSDRDREALTGTGIELASDTRSKAFDEQYLVYRTLTTAGSRLRISWPIADHEGRSMRPSIIISRLRKLFPSITETSDIIKPDAGEGETELAAGGTPAFRQMIAAFRRKADGFGIEPLWKCVYLWFSGQEDWRRKCLSAREAFLYKNIAQNVGRKNISALYGEPVRSSVSRLEKYTACPFAYYVQYGLGARERKIYRLSPPDVGTFMHSAIEYFSRLVEEKGVSWREFDREWCAARVSEIIDEMLEKMQGSGIAASKRYTALALRLKRVVTRAVWLIAGHIRRGGFDPAGYEIDFGEGCKYPPITIELDSGEQIRLTGRIDRVDALKTGEGTYLRIIDYKSGSRDFRLSDVYYGLQVQLITYLDAIIGEQEDALPAGMLYFRIDDPVIKKGGRISEEEVEQAIMRQLKMKGLLLADVRLIKEMDNAIEGSSMIIPAAINKGDVLGKNTSAASPEQFKLLRNHVRRLLKGLCEEVMKGNVSIRPYKKKGVTSCMYCSFSSICQFDAAMKENTFRLLHDRDSEEVWELISADSEGREKT